MDKADLYKKVAARCQISDTQAKTILDTFIDEMKTELTKAGGKITFRNFGTFSVRHRKASLRYNPNTGTKVEVPAKMVARFIPGQDLKRNA